MDPGSILNQPSATTLLDADAQNHFRIRTGLMLVEVARSQIREDSFQSPAFHAVCKLAHRCPNVACRCADRYRGLAEAMEEKPLTSTCWAGMTVTLLPSSSNHRVLLAGQVMIQPPRGHDLQRMKQEWSANESDWDRLVRQLKRVKVLPWADYQGHIRELDQTVERFRLKEEAKATVASIPPGIQRLCERLDDEFAETWSLGRAAGVACMSEYHFCRTFKQTKGMTLGHYLTTLRVKKAQELLSKGDRSVTEVAFAVGFQSISQFNRSFKNVTSRSPSAFRRDQEASS